MDSLCLHPRHEQFVHGERATFRAFVSAGLAGVGIGGVMRGLCTSGKVELNLTEQDPSIMQRRGHLDLLNQVMDGTRIRGP